MTNAYLNKTLFGHSKCQVDETYIRNLLPHMLTIDRVNAMQHFETKSQIQEPLEVEVEKHIRPEPVVAAFQRRKLVHNSLFWAIYDVECPDNVFQTRANAEIEQRLKVATELKKTPKRLKDTNSKLTIEQTQALLGSMLVTKEDKLEFCTAYAVYYKKSIVVVYEKTYRVFSPTVDIDISDPENVILLYASKPDKMIVYESEKNLSLSILQRIIETKIIGPLKSMSNYKNPELYELASKFHIDIFSSTKSATNKKNKTKKKEDIYNEIRVAMHIDMNFTLEHAYNK